MITHAAAMDLIIFYGRSRNCVQVWCWRSDYLAVPPAQQLIKHLEDWSNLRDGLTCDIVAGNKLRSCIKLFMHMMLKGQPHHDHLQVLTSSQAPVRNHDMAVLAVTIYIALSMLPSIVSDASAPASVRANAFAGLAVTRSWLIDDFEAEPTMTVCYFCTCHCLLDKSTELHFCC